MSRSECSVDVQLDRVNENVRSLFTYLTRWRIILSTRLDRVNVVRSSTRPASHADNGDHCRHVLRFPICIPFLHSDIKILMPIAQYPSGNENVSRRSRRAERPEREFIVYRKNKTRTDRTRRGSKIRCERWEFIAASSSSSTFIVAISAFYEHCCTDGKKQFVSALSAGRGAEKSKTIVVVIL